MLVVLVVRNRLNMKKIAVFACISIFAYGVLAANPEFTNSRAAPQCKDGFQLIKGLWIATPYCGEIWLAKVSGYSVRAIRNDPSARQLACQMYGSDPKVASLCGPDSDWYRLSR